MCEEQRSCSDIPAAMDPASGMNDIVPPFLRGDTLIETPCAVQHCGPGVSTGSLPIRESGGRWTRPGGRGPIGRNPPRELAG